MKEYKRMSGNLSWCKPFAMGNTAHYVQNEGEIISFMRDGKDLVIDAEALSFIADHADDFSEVGCASCPWRDECDAMETVAADWSTDELAAVVHDSDKWDDPDTEEAMRELIDRAGIDDSGYDSWEAVARDIQNVLNIDLGI